MADTKTTALTALTTAATTDILYIVDDPGGTPLSKKITVDNLVKAGDARTATLTNKAIDADNNTITNIALGAECTGASTDLTDTASIALLTAAQALTNKTIDADNNTITNIALGAECTGASTDLTDTVSIALLTAAQTLTNKTIDADNNTITNIALGAECTGASTDLTDTASIALLTAAQTLTNKTIDADNNTVSNIVIGAECTGASTALTDTADLTYNADTDVSGNGWVVDEDNMASDLATKVPTQQSVKAYADTNFEPLGEVTAINTQTGTTYTLALTDKGKVVEMNNASANTLTIPTNASVAFPTGSRVDIVQYGAGATTVDGDTGVTVNGVSGGGGALTAQYSAVSLYKRATDEWIVIGDIGTIA